MNILVLSWRDPKHPLAGGAEQVVNQHMQGWVKAGHKVVHFSSFFKGAKREEEENGILFIRRGRQLLGVQFEAFFWYLFSKHSKFDLVVDEFHGPPFFTPLYVRTKKMAILQEVARDVWLRNDLPFPFNHLIGITGYLLEPFFYLFYKKVPFMVGSSSAKEEVIKVGIPEKNVSVVHHGVILDLPKAMPKKEKVKTIVYLGALAKDKGIEDALKAFSLIDQTGNFQYWVIGRAGADYLVKLEQVADNLGISRKIRFWGFVSQKKKFDLLARAYMMLNPSLLEGWGLVNIEANSVGLPVIAYNSPGLTDSVKDGETGLICNTNTPEVLASNASKLMRDAKLYKKLEKGAIAWSKRFSWEASIRESLTLIARIVKLN